MKKLILTILMTFVLFSGLVMADSSNYDITHVYVNGIQVTEDRQVQVELGTTTQIVVDLEGLGETEDVNVKAWIGGYEYGNILDYTEMFDVEEGVTYRKYIYLEIPSDLQVQDHTYTLYVEVYDDESTQMLTYDLYMEEPRHSVDIKEVLLSSTSVEPGDYLGVKVRLENLGENLEKDIRVTVSLEGVSSTAYLEELGAKDSDTDDELSTETLYLVVPSGLSGDYEVNVLVEYDNGYTTVEKSSWLRIEGNSTVYDSDAIISVSSVSGLQVGQESEFKVQVTNLGDESKEFNLFVYGMDGIDYTDSVTVSEGRTSELMFTINPEQEGLQEVIVEVSSRDGLVEQRIFSVDVEEKSNLWLVLLSVIVAVLFIGGAVLHLRRL